MTAVSKCWTWASVPAMSLRFWASRSAACCSSVAVSAMSAPLDLYGFECRCHVGEQLAAGLGVGHRFAHGGADDFLDLLEQDLAVVAGQQFGFGEHPVEFLGHRQPEGVEVFLGVGGAEAAVFACFAFAHDDVVVGDAFDE